MWEQRRDKDSRAEASLPVRLSRRLPFPDSNFVCFAALACLCEVAVRKQGIHSHSLPLSPRQTRSIIFCAARARPPVSDWSVVSSGQMHACMGLCASCTSIGHRHRSTSVSARLLACRCQCHGLMVCVRRRIAFSHCSSCIVVFRCGCGLLVLVRLWMHA